MIQSTTAGFHLVEATSARIQIYTFGTLRVVRDHLAVSEGDWHTRQARQLLKILLTERPRPVSTDLLIEILWPNSTPSAAATTLRSAINALRNVLEPDRPNRAPSKYIVTQAPGYAFHTTPDIWLDVEEFERRLNAVQSVVDPGVRLVLLEGAIELYQDDYLISDPYADWLQTERERLRERFFNALLLAAEFYAEMGRYAEAITACRRMLARDEVRENAYQGLMRYQAESGDSAGALLTYERCRSILSDELGADPSPVTQILHQRILNGEIEPRPVVVSSAHASSLFATESVHLDTTLHAAPVLPARQLMPALDVSHASVFVGRESELARLESQIAAVEAGRGGLLILEGEAGIGKTRLAYHGLQHVAGRGLTAISATCQVLERELPFAPLVDGISRYLYGLPDLALRALPAASLAQIVPIIPGLQDRLYGYPVVPVEVAASPEENRLRLIDSIVSFLAALASARPLVLFLDDLQWADPDTLAVIGRLSQRLADVPILLLIAYRSEDLSENDALGSLLHSLNRVFAQSQLRLAPLNRAQVAELLIMQMGQDEERSRRLADLLHDATHGNALFVTETLRYLEEQGSALSDIAAAASANAGGGGWPQSFSLRRNQRVQETILERTLRLPLEAHAILNLCSVIGRDFSLELLEKASSQDPINALGVLLQRRFLIERPDERLDFSHQVVRQAVYDSLNLLQRRRLHLAVAEALVDLGQADQNPGEAAFHFGQAGASYRLLAAEYNVLAGEKLLRTYGFRQAVDVFDRALEVLEQTPDAPASFVRRALEGRGLAFESLFDPEGITNTYRRLQAWARQHGDRSVLVATYSRLTTMLGLMGQQHESNVELRELLRALSGGDPDAVPSHVLIDLLHRRELIYSQDEGDTEGWQEYVPATRPVAHPVDDLLRVLEPVHAVPPLFDYGWTLLVQGELGESTRVLEAVVDLATSTNQPSIASAAYHQLAVTARILGDLEQSQTLNDASIAINRARPGTAAELASMWPRIASGFLSLHAGRLDEAERRLRRVADFLGDRRSFGNYRNSANIGLGLVALARGERGEARRILEGALTDPVHLYPYTHVHALLGLARIAHEDGDTAARDRLLRQALRFAGRRGLLEEYIASITLVGRLRPASAPFDTLLQSVLEYVRSIGLDAAVKQLLALSAAEKLDTGLAPIGD